jgi:hypothetical protein
MRKRWMMYAGLGLGFGIADWYFLDALSNLGRMDWLNSAVQSAPLVGLVAVMLLVGLNYGVWLVPVIPAAVYEARRSASLVRTALAGALVWASAIISYYAFYTFQLMFVGLPNVGYMLFSNRQSPTYWEDWRPLFQRVIADQFLQWIGIAVVGGAIAGAGTAVLYRSAGRRWAALRQPSSAT